MAVIRPFECVRPAEKVADRVAALPMMCMIQRKQGQR